MVEKIRMLENWVNDLCVEDWKQFIVKEQSIFAVNSS